MSSDVQFAPGGIEMVVVHGFRSYLVLSALGLGMGGCAGQIQGSRQAKSEVRESIAVLDSQPRMLLVGPARLLHVQVEKRKGGVRLFRVPRQYGTNADCRAVADKDEVALAVKTAAVDITRDEVVCAKVDRKARVSWHATAKPEFVEPPGTLHQASLLP